MHANKPEMAREWEAHTPKGKKLPMRASACRRLPTIGDGFDKPTFKLRKNKVSGRRLPMIGQKKDYYREQSMPDFEAIWGTGIPAAKKKAAADQEHRRRAAGARMVHSFGFHGEATPPVKTPREIFKPLSERIGGVLKEASREAVAVQERLPKLKQRIPPDDPDRRVKKGEQRGGKYVRRVATGNPKRPWRYIYQEGQERAAATHESVRHWVSGKEYGFSETNRHYGTGETRVTSMGDRIGVYNEERSKLHQQIIDSFVGHPPSVRPPQKPVAVVMMGGPAAGKGTLLRAVQPGNRREGVSDDFVNVNPDDVKEKLPEYKAMLDMGQHEGKTMSAKDAAHLVHEESSDVAKMVLERAVANRQNVVVDGTGKDSARYREKIKQLVDAGYHVRLLMPHVPLEEAQTRAKERAERQGRYVPDEYVVQAHHVIPGNFFHIAEVAHEAYLYDNGAPPSPPPKPMWVRDLSGERTYNATALQAFHVNARAKQSAAREKGWMKSMTDKTLKKGEGEPSVSTEEFMRRIEENYDPNAHDSESGVDDDNFHEFQRHLEQEK